VNIKNLSSADALVELIVAEKGQMEKIDEDFIRQLDKEAALPTEDFPYPPSEMSVLENLARLLSVLKDKHMLSPELPTSILEPINEFLTQYHRVKRLEEDLGKGPGKQFVNLKPKADHLHEPQSEDTAPVKPSTIARVKLFMPSSFLLPQAATTKVMQFRDYLACNQFAAATSILMYGILLKSTPSWDMQVACGNLLIAAPMFVINAVLLNHFTHMVGSQTNAVGRRTDNMASWVDRSSSCISGEGREFLQKIADRFFAFKFSIFGGTASFN